MFECTAMMGGGLWSEKSCTSLFSSLPLWIIEYAWSERMTDVLEVLGPPPWLESEWERLTLKDQCSMRVMAAESWMIIRIRDIKHFERVMSFLDVTYTLLPHLVTPIKHMKIMFGLKTLIIMYLLWDNQNTNRIADKLVQFFPESLPLYHRSNCKHMHLMQKTQQDFRIFAQALASNPEMRKTYIRDTLEEQYGERYALKLEERLLHYLEELEKAFSQPTYIDQVLKQSYPLRERKLLHQLLTNKSVSLSTTLKKLLRCAMTTHYGPDNRGWKKNETEENMLDSSPFCITFRPSQERTEEEKLSQVWSQRSWLDRDNSPSLLQKTCADGQVTMSKIKSDQRPMLCQDDKDPCAGVEQDANLAEAGLVAEPKEAEDDSPKNLCSKHAKRMNTILQQCSDEFKGQNEEPPLMHAECTPQSPHQPRFQSTPDRFLIDTSVSSLQDSSSTNISLSSHPDSSSTNISICDLQQLSPSLSFPLKPNSDASVQQFRITAASAFSAQSLFSLSSRSTSQQISPVSSVHAPLSHTPSSLSNCSYLASSATAPSASRAKASQAKASQAAASPAYSASPASLAPRATSSSTSSASRASSGSPATASSTSLATALPATAFSASPVSSAPPATASPAHCISPPASSSLQQDSSSSLPPFQQINSSNILGHQSHLLSSTSSSSPPLVALTLSHNAVEFSGTTGQDLTTRNALKTKPRLSLETQDYLLLCRWMQPQVLLCRLSQQECAFAKNSNTTYRSSDQSDEEETGKEMDEDDSFDVNVLYSDSQSETDTKDSDDPDYVPSKKFKV